jgi:SAM-dependent methyltransferase
MPELYEEIAELYHLVYEDWESAIVQQAAALDAVLRELVGPGRQSILDVSCGIGTQALGLAQLGHRVSASDVSPAAVGRAEREASIRGLAINFAVGDMRSCSAIHPGSFDVVMSADNSVPHLLDDDAILDAFRDFYECLRPGGLALITVRDYAADDRTTPQLRPYGFRVDGDSRYFVVQTRDWDGDHYRVSMYFIREALEDFPVWAVAGSSQYYAVTTDRLQSLFKEAGFVQAQRLDDAFFQPVVIARRDR